MMISAADVTDLTDQKISELNFMAIHSTDGAAVRVPATHSSTRGLPSNQNPRSFTVTGFRLSTPLFTLRFL